MLAKNRRRAFVVLQWWFVTSVLLLLMLAALAIARAQPAAPTDCSGTVGTTAAAVSFPASGAHGPSVPGQYIFIVNPSATATLWLDIKGGTAAANAAGSFPLVGLGNSVTLSPPPATISIIASAASTPYTCNYR